jgi:hypothetical protein
MTSADTKEGAPAAGAGVDYRIHLNFIAVDVKGLRCRIFRRSRTSDQDERPLAAAAAHRLPLHDPSEDAWPSYWVVADQAAGFEPFDYDYAWNPDLSRRILFDCLKRSVVANLASDQFEFPANSFVQEVSLIMKKHEEGAETLEIQPYSLKATQQIGFLVDFHFRKSADVEFSRKVQQLSLSLDRNFRRNVDYYADRTAKLRSFLQERWHVFEDLTLPGSNGALNIRKEFVSLSAERLRPKVYVFAGGKEGRSQFAGLRDFGPLEPLQATPRLLFAFREQDRTAARRLAMAIRGLKQRGQFNFPGFQKLFGSDVDIDSDPIVLPDLSSNSMESALERAKAEHPDESSIVPVIVLPYGDDNGYLEQKAFFSHAGLPTQVCTLKVLQDEESLKWSIANIALQIFCKAGGRPWKVRPTSERSLIIGISQSHKLKTVDSRRLVEKYFAFSVLTDSSGLFQKIQVLGDETDHGVYLAALSANLKQALLQNAGAFQRVVIHTSFKLKYDEIRAIQKVTQEVASADRGKCRFSVIKVNQHSRFFGTNRSVNSLVPYEATKVRLGPHEYLVWFEGIYPDKPNVTKAFPGPTHLQFLKVEEDGTSPAEERELLQDIVNLSGANWRGFNAKSAPVSVFYCHLVADLVHSFHEQGLPMPAVQDIQPWFL